MKQAIVQHDYQGIDTLQLETLPTGPLHPLTARIMTRFTPVLPYDLLTESGQLKQLRPVQLPAIVGYAFGGIVTAVGTLRDHHLIGQPVIGATLSGSNQTIIDSNWPPLLFPVPTGLSLATATTVLGGADAALATLQHLQLPPRATVLLMGASGSVGSYLLQLLKQRQIQVITVAHSRNQTLLNDLGADWQLFYDQPLAEQLRGLPPIDHLIDLAGNAPLLTTILTSSDATVPVTSLALQSYRPPKLGQSFEFISGRISSHDYQNLLHQLASGQLHAVINHRYPFTAVKAAQTTVQTGHLAGRTLLNYPEVYA